MPTIQEEKMPQKISRFLLPGDISVLTQKGNRHSLEELAGEYEVEVIVLALDAYGRITTAKLSNFHLEKAVKQTTNVTFFSGLKLALQDGDSLRSAAGDPLTVLDLEFSSIVLGAVYDPSSRAPLFSTDEVLHTHRERHPEPLALFSFDIDSADKELLITKTVINGVRPELCPMVALRATDDSNI